MVIVMLLIEYRQAIIDAIPELKGQKILYYKDIGKPSHASTLDYLINKYDWDKNGSDNTIGSKAVEESIGLKLLLNLIMKSVLKEIKDLVHW